MKGNVETGSALNLALWKRLLFVSILLMANGGQAAAHLKVASRSNTSEWPVLANVVRKRAGEELVVARNAEAVAATHAEGMLVDQQALIADMAVETAEDDFAKSRAAAPAAKAAISQAQRFLAQAQYHADHARRVLEEFKELPEAAAEKAMKTIEQDVKNEANAAAEYANKLPPETKVQRKDKFAKRVAAAMQPWHLAELRAQKYVAETYAKAKSAVKASEQLISESMRLAQSAQRLQMTRLPVQAKQMMLFAVSTMQKAQMMRKWADELYAQAQKVNESLGAYPVAESRAANMAAKTVPLKVQPTLPPTMPQPGLAVRPLTMPDPMAPGAPPFILPDSS